MAVKKQQGKRMSPVERRQQQESILDAALAVAQSIGYAYITREQVAKEAGVSPSLISAYLGTVPKFRRAVFRRAIAVENLAVIAQGLLARDPRALKLPDDLKQRAIDALR
jgi:AcrR family transcriptional regulator